MDCFASLANDGVRIVDERTTACTVPAVGFHTHNRVFAMKPDDREQSFTGHRHLFRLICDKMTRCGRIDTKPRINLEKLP